MSHADNQREFQNMLDDGFHCSQCVFLHWSRKMGLEDEFALRLASGLGLGVNHGDSCGAVTGSVLALGLAHGFSDASQAGREGGVEKMTRAFEAKFEERNGALLCRKLLTGGYDGADPNAKAPEGVDPWENCAKYCADSVELAEEFLSDANLRSIPSPVALQAPAPSPVAVGAGSGVAGLVIGAGAAAVVAYEKRRAENERKK